MPKKKPLTQTELSSLGGKATKAKLGVDHYREMARKRWAKSKPKAKAKAR